MVWEESILTMPEHEGGKISYDGRSLDMKLAQHGIVAPASHEADNIRVYVRVEEGHCSGGSEGVGGDILGKKSNGRAEEVDSIFEDESYI